MKKISPWLTLIIGYVLGYVLYPMLQMWTCRCDRSIDYLPEEAFRSLDSGGQAAGAGLASARV